jgi:hypothetical protein
MISGKTVFNSCCIFLFISAIAFISCEEKIDIELNDQDQERIVVEGRITNELKNHKVRLTKSLSYFANEQGPALITNNAYIYEEGTGTRYNLRSLEAEDINGLYATDIVAGKIGETYTLVIEDGDDTYQASDYMDTIPGIDSAGYIYEYYKYFEMGFYIFRISAWEPPPVGHNYMFHIFLNDTLYNDELVETPYVNDLLYDGIYLENIEIYYIPQEEIVDSIYQVRIDMLSISEEEYTYNNTFLQESYNNGSIFSGPPANVTSNVKNTNGGVNGVGFFGAASVTSIEFTLKKEHNDSTNNPDYEYD